MPNEPDDNLEEFLTNEPLELPLFSDADQFFAIKPIEIQPLEQKPFGQPLYFDLGVMMRRVFERFGMDDPMWNTIEYLAAKRYRNLGSCTNALVRLDLSLPPAEHSLPDFRDRMKKYDKDE